MKKMTLTASIAGASVLIAATALAEHHGQKKEGHDWEAKMAAKFAEVDADGSGAISRDEFLAHKAAAAEKEWDEHAEVAGDDGEVSLDEAKAYHKAKYEAKKAKMKEGDE